MNKKKRMMKMIDVKIKYLSKYATPPEYATDGSLGMDVSAAVAAPMTIKAGERVLVPMGFALEIPEGWGAFIFPRSGLSFRKGISMSNCVGVIDNDYRGEVKASVINLSDKDYVINPGDRIAQMLFLPVEKAKLTEASELYDTERAGGGFGSTGV
ncbi:MAG: dUTP diphosphatase [Clostridia bacterium]|nr:dUTP diphosphatase [Clostridia bacterium]